MSDYFTVCVPATSANLGPGFDSFGLALSLYNIFKVSPSEQYNLTYTQPIDPKFTQAANNLVITTYQHTCNKNNWQPTPFNLEVENNVPLSSGLGSSSTAVIAGVAIAYQLHNQAIDHDKILLDALECESHIDNIGAALYGGFIIGMVDIPSVYKISITTDICCWAITPKLAVSTAASRQDLPTNISMQDTVYNLSHASAVAASFARGDFTNLRHTLADKLHEPYRVGGQLDYSSLREQLYKHSSVYSMSLSGSGPSILVLASSVTAEMQLLVQQHFAHIGVEYQAHILEIDNTGLQIIN
jgi:homoserine kinase